jgi:hypothetical protein
MSEYTNLSDDELLRRVQVLAEPTLLELELSARLERALEEMQTLTQEIESGNDARRAGQDRRKAGVEFQGNLVFLPSQ